MNFGKNSVIGTYGMGAFRAQKVGVHGQPVEEDFDATRGLGSAKNNLSNGYRQ